MTQPDKQAQAMATAKTMPKHTLVCLIQNRLGGLDRVLSALTARGYIPERFVASAAGAERMQIMMTLTTEGEKELEKLIKVLYKQVYVIEIQLIMAKDDDANVLPFDTSIKANASDLSDRVKVAFASC